VTPAPVNPGVPITIEVISEPGGEIKTGCGTNMIMEFQNAVGVRAGNGSRLLTARKFLKIYVAYLFRSATFPRPGRTETDY
jgi:hypothetical protein